MSIKIFEEGIKFSRRSRRGLLWGFSARNDNEIQTNCRVEFDVKKNKNNKNLVGSYLRCAYNHVLLEKNFTLYQIRCLTRRKLRIYFEHALFHRLSHSWQAIIGFDHISPSASSISDLGLWDDLGSLGSISNKKKLRAKPISDRSNFQKRPQCERGLFRSTTVERKHEKSVCSST